ncbi:MAG: mannonate dehydratase [Cyclobacteriaceae bacterium]|nr:mannonate dehydratase [Cyclobacteriaceae bacterium]
MKLTMLLPPRYYERKWTLARQIGVNHAITKAMPLLSGREAPYDFEALNSIKAEFEQAGFRLYGLEGDQFDMSPIKLGLPSRDALIEKYQQMLHNMARLDIRLLCYNFMVSIGWMRTKVDVAERGGALTSEFDFEAVKDELMPEAERISEARVWENLYYFLDAVLPVADELGIQMALHPDDPPLSPLKGVGRILTSAAAFDQIIAKYPSPANGITFCQATFRTMGEDIKAISEKWIKDRRIFFLHLRDVEGDKYKFRETFHDNGPTPMAEMLRHYAALGFDGPIRPDHAPAMYGERQDGFEGGISVGYEMLGKIFAIGYLKGIMESNGINYE